MYSTYVRLQFGCSLDCSLVEKVEWAIQLVLDTLSNFEQLKLQWEECLRHFNAGKDVMALTAHTISGKFYWAGALHATAAC